MIIPKINHLLFSGREEGREVEWTETEKWIQTQSVQYFALLFHKLAN